MQARVCAGATYETTRPAAELQQRFEAEAVAKPEATTETTTAAAGILQQRAAVATPSSAPDPRLAAGLLRSTSSTAKGRSTRECVEGLGSRLEEANAQTAGVLGEISNSTVSFMSRQNELKKSSTGDEAADSDNEVTGGARETRGAR